MVKLQDTPFPGQMSSAGLAFRQPAFTNTDNVHIAFHAATMTLCGIWMSGGSVTPQFRTTTCEKCAEEARRIVGERDV